MYCPKCTSFFTKSGDDLIYHFPKKNTVQQEPKRIPRVKNAALSFQVYSLRHHKQRYHTAEATSSGEKVEMQSLADAGDAESLEEELQSCRPFLVNSEIQKERQNVLNFVVNNLRAQVTVEKMDRFLDKLKCAAKLNLALGFILENIKDGKFRFFYAHENNTLLEQPKIVSNKDDTAKLEEILKKNNVTESCKKNCYEVEVVKLTNFTIFAAPLRVIPMGCKFAVPLEPLLIYHTVNCLTYEQNTKKP